MVRIEKGKLPGKTIVAINFGLKKSLVLIKLV